MKKTFVILLSALSVFVFCACSTTASIFSGSYWLKNPSTREVAEIDEELNYKVSFKALEANGNEKLEFSLEDSDTANSSYYKTKLVASSDEGFTDCYKLSTELVLKGKFTFKGENAPEPFLADYSITTYVYFKGIDDALAPVKSSRTVVAYSPISENSAFTIKACKYTITTEYSGKTAKTNVVANDGNEIKLDDNLGEKEYNNYNDNTYFDNELTFFFPRSLSLGTNYKLEYNTIDAISKENCKMLLQSSAEASGAKAMLSLTGYYENGNPIIKETSTTIVNIIRNSTSASGSAIKCWYADISADQRCRLLKFETTALSSLGTLTCTLTDANYMA